MSDTLTPDELREIRVNLGLSQRDMERALHLKDSRGRSIRRFESGETTPSGAIQYLYALLRDGVIQP